MEIKILHLQSRYTEEESRSLLSLTLEIDGRQYQTVINAEPKPGILRHGLIFIGLNNSIPPAVVNGEEFEGFTDDPNIFRLAIAFGLEVRYRRFKVGGKVVQIPDPGEVKDLGERLEKYALPGAPSWESLTISRYPRN